MTFDAPPELVLLVPPWWLLALVAYATVWLAVACGRPRRGRNK